MKNILVYGVGNLSFSIVGNTISNFFMFFGTSVLGLGGTLTGIAVALSTAWNGIGDPFVGYISDIFAIGKLGNRKGYMLFATIGMCVINIAVWCVPLGLSTALKFIWVFVSLLLIQTCITFFSTPYYALGVDITNSKNHTTKIVISKTIFMFVGLVLPSVLLTIFLPNSIEYPIGQLNPYGYRHIAYVTSIVCATSALLCIFLTKTPHLEPKSGANKLQIGKMFKSFARVFKIDTIRKLIIASSLSDVSAVVLMSIGMHFFTYCFYYSSRQITTLLIALLVGATLSQLLWYKMSKVSKLNTVLTSIFVTVSGVFAIMLVYVFRFQLNAVSYYLALVCMLICGAGSGALYTIPLSMYNDEVRKMDNSTDGAGTYTGMLTFTSSIVCALTQLLSGVLLDIIGFDSKLADQTLGVQMGLALMLFVGIMTVLILAYYFFSKTKSR